uniref:Uncharacterized protein n=1 Tax=Panagrolaimus superbus TaxID=310955 RepID=A0A914Y8Y0_9BILA
MMSNVYLNVMMKSGKNNFTLYNFFSEVDGISLLEKRGTVKGSIFTHDEPSLQSPRTLSTAQNLTPLLFKDEEGENIELKKIKIDQLPTLSDVFPQYLHHPYHQPTDFHQHSQAQYPHHPWPISDSSGNAPFDFSAYYHHHPMAHGYHPQPNDYAFNGWFPDSSNAGFFSADQINGYYAAAAQQHHHHLYPEPPKPHSSSTPIPPPPPPINVQPQPPPLPTTVFFPEQTIPTTTSEDGTIFDHKFTLPSLNTFKSGKHDGLEASNNFSFLNEVAHTLFGQ